MTEAMKWDVNMPGHAKAHEDMLVTGLPNTM